MALVHATRSPMRKSVTSGPAAVTTPAPSIPGTNGSGFAVEPGAMVGVEVVDPRRLAANDDLAVARHRIGDVREAQHLGTSERVDANRPHANASLGSPRLSLRRVMLTSPE